jgi:hypothetical protein
MLGACKQLLWFTCADTLTEIMSNQLQGVKNAEHKNKQFDKG